ncbi:MULTISPECIES: metal ABC transporter ATP-binding protein [unclassified Arthrobacter]|uniref:metal ABC transporter ATP-binding protein n=1 Tax=unclassified Arthrobacter TaxID=235627 RepID=UPI00041CAC19|nr:MULTISPECIES: ABC transporter ATP-binding protein [unclassified Arthrobacter]PVE14772.1 ABC transporter ATP-binding protein [Arthrobacter sp. Bz4]
MPDHAQTAVLEFDRVSYGYGRVPVLTDVSLRLEAGAFTAVVGPNGAGKTTLVRLALGLVRPTDGSIRLFGTDTARFRQWSWVGYVPQRAETSSVLPISVNEVVRSGLAGRLRPLQRISAVQHERIEHVLDVMGLQAVRRHRITELSGGQQQRALVARALVTTPRLLFLDEPTTGVDTEAKAALRASLEHLVHVEGIAVVYISHDPAGFTGLAHRVLEVRDGNVLPLPDVTTSVTAPTVRTDG